MYCSTINYLPYTPPGTAPRGHSQLCLPIACRVLLYTLSLCWWCVPPPPLLHCPKSNPNFRDIAWNVEENQILHEIFRVVSRFPRYISCYIAENRLPLGQCIPYCCWENINSAWLVRKVHFFSIMHIRAYPPPPSSGPAAYIFSP